MKRKYSFSATFEKKTVSTLLSDWVCSPELQIQTLSVKLNTVVQRCNDWTCEKRFSQFDIQYNITRVLQRWSTCFCLEDLCEIFFICQDNSWFAASHKICANSRKILSTAKNTFEYIDIFSWTRNWISDPKATWSNVFVLTAFSFLVIINHEGITALLNLALFKRTSWLPRSGFFVANLQAPLNALFTYSNVCWISVIIMIGVSAFRKLIMSWVSTLFWKCNFCEKLTKSR